MAWKIERWLADVFPGMENIFAKYHELDRRELVIVASSSLDLALAELISKRLMDYPKELEECLGADEDGRAPLGSFGARIQMAHLLGILTAEDVAILRIIKAIRNKFAHRVNIDFTSEQVKPLVRALYDKQRERTRHLIVGTPSPSSTQRHVRRGERLGAWLLDQWQQEQSAQPAVIPTAHVELRIPSLDSPERGAPPVVASLTSNDRPAA